MRNGWQEIPRYSPDMGPVELWVERPGFLPRHYLNCTLSRQYGWLDEARRSFGDGSVVRAWRPPTKGPDDE